MKTGRVFLVGAGPGDPALLTEQGRKCLEQADAVVYDALACSSVLNLTKPDCSLIFAGKMAGNHYKKQSETNRLLVELAEQGKQVVRLKGGDPFVFGRGGEEAQVLQENGIPFSIVPGAPGSPPAIMMPLSSVIRSLRKFPSARSGRSGFCASRSRKSQTVSRM